MMMERQGSGPALAVAMAALQRRTQDATTQVIARDSLYTASLTPEELAQLDLSNKSSLETLVTVVSAVAMALITSIVVLRLTVRRYSVGRFFLDDYLVILASIFTLVVCSVVIAATKYGLGQHVWNLDLAHILDNLKVCIQLMFVANIFYAAAIAFTKLSIIASYLHIFAPRGLFKTMLYATAGVTVGLGVASVPATIFECIPVAGAWTLMDNDAHCYTFINFLYASTAINVTTDLILCIAPIPLFWRLQLPQRQKIMISVLFFLGGFACIASIIRLAYLHLLYDPIDVTYDLVSSVMWTIAECTIGIVCVSLPPLRSLFAKFLPSVFGNVHNSSHGGGGAGGMAGYGSRQKSPLSPLSPHHYFARQQGSSNGTIGNNTRQPSNSKAPPLSQKSADIVVLSSLTSRHSRLSLHSSFDEDDDTSSTGHFAQKLSRGVQTEKRNNSNVNNVNNYHHNYHERHHHLPTGVSATITAGAALSNDGEKQRSATTAVSSAAGDEVPLKAPEPVIPAKHPQRSSKLEMEMGLIGSHASTSSLPDSEARLESGWDGRHGS
ncbi:hypothetical protein SBRCBS47491_001696 [Sporothrix bragantina]|uniref:Rhodopsin domain-containing protein n=1 Tax=Sporothrix bragantina TaxID=671064 RepID=A0ABP0B1F7_9PEZI